MPGPCRIFFPSLDGAVFDAPVLEGCGLHPLIIFCHGQCELDTEHYKKWYEVPAALARSGYLAARYAGNASIDAFASLSGQGIRPAFELRIPKLFTWGDDLMDPFSRIEDSTWASIAPNRHRAAFEGAGHFDYLPAGRSKCEEKHGRRLHPGPDAHHGHGGHVLREVHAARALADLARLHSR